MLPFDWDAEEEQQQLNADIVTSEDILEVKKRWEERDKKLNKT